MSRTPPAAGWPVAADRWAQSMAGALWAAAGASLAAVVAARLELGDFATGAAAVSVAGLLGALAYRRARQPAGRLSWSGEGWWWHPGADDAAGPLSAQDGGVAGEPVALQPPRVMLDLDGWMLLRCGDAGGGRVRWISLRGDSRPGPPGEAAWSAFRAAVYSPATRTDSRPRAPGDTSS